MKLLAVLAVLLLLAGSSRPYAQQNLAVVTNPSWKISSTFDPNSEPKIQNLMNQVEVMGGKVAFSLTIPVSPDFRSKPAYQDWLKQTNTLGVGLKPTWTITASPELRAKTSFLDWLKKIKDCQTCEVAFNPGGTAPVITGPTSQPNDNSPPAFGSPCTKGEYDKNQYNLITRLEYLELKRKSAIYNDKNHVTIEKKEYDELKRKADLYDKLQKK